MANGKIVKVRVDLTGQKFGRLTVIERAEDRIDPRGIRSARWLCECSCEAHTRKIVEQSHLKSGKILSCGCYNKERIRETHKKIINMFYMKITEFYGQAIQMKKFILISKTQIKF